MKPLSPFALWLLLCLAITTVCFSQDWAQLQYFASENQELMMNMVSNHRVVFMGNSITEGWSNARPEFFEGKPYVNRGIGGQTTPQMLVRFKQDVVSLQPTVVVILAGTNDIAGNTGPSTIEMIFDNITSMAEIARANDINVILCSVLPVYDYPWKPGLKPAEKIVRLNSMIRQYAQENNMEYVDYFSAMVNKQNGLKSDLGHDGVHPNKAGYQVMEPLLTEAIEKALNR
ncbi:MAG: acylhydrolase [Flavobacteriaceae bacterium]|nr:acylhydrolase [Flavobacteriaceae bacterium]|tara:strand:+ start:20628 stop:21317 length:690 start_codon:yes stop_codon:yes gene_type:complete